MAAFAHEMEIEVGEEKGKGVGIEEFEGIAGVGAALNFVAAGFRGSGLIGRPDRFEQTLGTKFYGVGNLGGRDNGIFEHDAGFGGPGHEEADGPASGNWMGAENAEGIGVLSGEQSVNAGVEVGARWLLRGRLRRGCRLGVFGRQDWILRQSE